MGCHFITYMQSLKSNPLVKVKAGIYDYDIIVVKVKSLCRKAWGFNTFKKEIRELWKKSIKVTMKMQQKSLRFK